MEPTTSSTTPSHSRANSHNSYSIHLHESSSSRNSMHLIEETSQNYGSVANAHVQRQRWDAFFEPQYSFGSFVHGSNQPLDNAQEHKKKLDRMIDDSNHLLDTSKSPRSSTRPSHDLSRASTPTAGIMTPSLPCLDGSNTSSVDNQKWQPRDEKTLIERLELLKKIRAQADAGPVQKPNEHDLGDHNPTDTTTARWKRQFAQKAKKFCKEAQVDSKSMVSSCSSSDLSCEKKYAAPDEEAVTRADATGSGNKKICCRRSFICFVLGFLFPPLWLWGAFYISSYAQRQTSASNRIDHIWRRRSRIAFGIFTITLMIILVIVFVLKPETVGWRQAKQQPLP
ncbi:hypothetical protein [Parasitella parasitica]|uniref:Uncharacterized protein n=1 Tax=Parasitella parasitica TaxID=35722 RepID=A0A0B7N1N6_9FUNG|nr:hypothetical protein [Parasitella parasitica]